MFKKYSIFFLTLAQSCMLASGAIAPHRTTKNNIPTIIEAIRENNVAQLKILLRTIPDINMPINNEGTTLLMVAARCGWTSILNELLKADADPNIQQDNGMTALHIAAQIGNAACVHALLFNGATSKRLPDGRIPLDLAFLSNNLECICELAPQQQDLDKALLIAVRHNLIAQSETVLELGANVNTTALLSGHTPLTEAIRNNNLTLVLKLLAAGADPNQEEIEVVFDDQSTPMRTPPLVLATMNNFTDIAIALLEWGADPRIG